MDQNLYLSTLLSSGLAHCQAAVDGNEGLILSLFLAGLAGGLTHCLGMCAPFVISQVEARLQAVPLENMGALTRLRGAALAPYHLGRMTTYAALGALGAAIGGGLANVTGLAWLGPLLLGFAGLFFLGYALKGLGAPVPGIPADGKGPLARAVGRWVRPLFVHPVGLRGYVLGVALGFLPCGLVYGALAAAAGSADPLLGAFDMVAFWAGTVPTLFGVGLAGDSVMRRWPAQAKALAPAILIVNGGYLLYLAWGMM